MVSDVEAKGIGAALFTSCGAVASLVLDGTSSPTGDVTSSPDGADDLSSSTSTGAVDFSSTTGADDLSSTTGADDLSTSTGADVLTSSSTGAGVTRETEGVESSSAFFPASSTTMSAGSAGLLRFLTRLSR
jgi:hypothetical protein